MKGLVVDDDPVLADLVAFTLRREGFDAILAHDGQTALDRWRDESPDFIILDVNLPRTVPPLDGFEVCRRIREEADTPVILLTVREDEDDIVKGLKLGADDYVLKPFSPRQLVARVEAVLRRAGKSSQPATWSYGELVYDPGKREVRQADRAPVSLTPLESRLLRILISKGGTFATIEELIDYIWGPGKGNREMLRQLVKRLRAKIEVDAPEEGGQHITIENIPGLGYGLIKKERN